MSIEEGGKERRTDGQDDVLDPGESQGKVL